MRPTVREGEGNSWDGEGGKREPASQAEAPGFDSHTTNTEEEEEGGVGEEEETGTVASRRPGS